MHDCVPHDAVLFSIWWVIGGALAGVAVSPLVGYLLLRRRASRTKGPRRG